MSIQPTEYIDQHFDAFCQDLFESLKFKSISADSAYQDEVHKCAEDLKNHLTTIGLENVKIMPTDGFPVVYADWLHAPNAPTVLLYGHYDVQPPDPLDLWDSPAFEPEIREGYIYARGVSDDKGQVYCHLKALQTLLATEKTLPINIKIMIEGEEEVGSPNLLPYVQANKDLLKADIALISDTPILGPDQPSVCMSLRGLCYQEITLTTAAGDLHSGQHGGALLNPIHELSKMISKLHDANNRVTIPGFYDTVQELTPEHKEEIATLPFNEQDYLNDIGAQIVSGEEGYNTLERRWFRPTLDVNGIWGGYTGEGAKTVLPNQASAKISMRLVANQDPNIINQNLKNYLQELTPKGTQVDITIMTSGAPAMVDPENPYIKKAQDAYKEGFGKKAVIQGEGGSIPIVAEFKKELGLDTVLMGFNLPDDQIHAPNERFKVSHYKNGIKTALAFYKSIAD